MGYAYSQEQEMLRDSVRSFLGDKLPMARVRELMETESGLDSAAWTEMAAMGLPAMHIPERYGGAGFSYRELGIVMEEMGRALTPSPMLSSVVLGANLLLLAGSEEQRTRLLPAIASGETTVAVAIAEPGRDGAANSDTTAVADGDEIVLTGTKAYVVDGHTAGVLIVGATDESGEVVFHIVDAESPGVTRRRSETLDMTRKQAEVALDGTRVPASARLEGRGETVVSRLYDLAVVALAHEQVGGAQICMEMSVDYAKERVQFGRPIGSFQAIKHLCADMLVRVESARSAAYHAAAVVDVDEAELRIAAPLAKAACSDAYFQVAADMIQVLGGVGFTWEHDAHLHFKRARTSQLMFGDPGVWRSELADRLGV
jgi:alkylation response protein AidB-like acyl-CoA dehydrogenase